MVMRTCEFSAAATAQRSSPIPEKIPIPPKIRTPIQASALTSTSRKLTPTSSGVAHHHNPGVAHFLSSSVLACTSAWHDPTFWNPWKAVGSTKIAEIFADPARL